MSNFVSVILLPFSEGGERGSRAFASVLSLVVRNPGSQSKRPGPLCGSDPGEETAILHMQEGNP